MLGRYPYDKVWFPKMIRRIQHNRRIVQSFWRSIGWKSAQQGPGIVSDSQAAEAHRPDLIYIFLLLASLFPVFGVQAAYYVVLFFFMDTTDEFQLLRFITNFKGVQFYTTGVLTLISGTVSFYICAMSPNHSCDEHGPGRNNAYLLLEFVASVVQIGLIWTCFYFLRSSACVKKGGVLYEDERLVGSKLLITRTKSKKWNERKQPVHIPVEYEYAEVKKKKVGR